MVPGHQWLIHCNSLSVRAMWSQKLVAYATNEIFNSQLQLALHLALPFLIKLMQFLPQGSTTTLNALLKASHTWPASKMEAADVQHYSR